MKIWLLRCNAPSHRCNGGCLRGGRGSPAAHHNHNVLASVPRGWQGNVHLAGIAPSKPFGVSPCSHCAKQAFWATRVSARPFGARGKEPDTLTTRTPLIRHHGPQTQHARTNSPPHALERAGKRKHTGVPSQLRWAGFGGSDEEHSRDSPRREVLRAIIEQPHRLD